MNSSSTTSNKTPRDETLDEGNDYHNLEADSKNDGRITGVADLKADHVEFSPDDEEIQRDAANDRVACVVHLALMFFAFLVVAAVALCSVVVAKFGLIAFGLLGMLVLLFASLVAFVNKVLRDDAKLKPVRRQLQRWQALATAVVLQEVRNFQLDWHEHLLLTDGNVVYENDEVTGDDNDEDIHATFQKAARGKRGKSIIFRLVVKPFLNIKGRTRRRKQDQTATNAASEAETAYAAPASNA
jgi:hypothetical protein